MQHLFNNEAISVIDKRQIANNSWIDLPAMQSKTLCKTKVVIGCRSSNFVYKYASMEQPRGFFFTLSFLSINYGRNVRLRDGAFCC